MDERIREPDDPDAVDRDVGRQPHEESPHREPGSGDDEPMMRFPGEDSPDMVGESARDTSGVVAPDDQGETGEAL